MSDFAGYIHAQETTARWRAERDYAGANLDLARIKERMYELRFQFEPLAGRIDGAFKGPGCADPEDIRTLILDAIFYVVVGRFPS